MVFNHANRFGLICSGGSVSITYWTSLSLWCSLHWKMTLKKLISDRHLFPEAVFLKFFFTLDNPQTIKDIISLTESSCSVCLLMQFVNLNQYFPIGKHVWMSNMKAIAQTHRELSRHSAVPLFSTLFCLYSPQLLCFVLLSQLSSTLFPVTSGSCLHPALINLYTIPVQRQSSTQTVIW